MQRLFCVLFVLLTGCYQTVDPEGFDLATRYGVSGLATNPNPIVGVPPGALSVADNVVFRRIGMAEPRPGFAAGSALTSMAAIWKLIPYDSTLLAVGPTRSSWVADTHVLTEAAAELSWTKHQIRGVEARKNLYLTTSDATRKLTSGTDTSAEPAGLQAPLMLDLHGLNSGSVITTGYTVAYRYVIRRTDPNGIVIRSTPSSRLLIDNTAGGSRQVALDYFFGKTTGFVAGDVIELYRTEQVLTSSADPPDELFLVHEIALGSSDITAGYLLNDSDTTLDADLGAALYTNSSQESIARSNLPPPAAKDLALFKDSTFAANITWPHLMEVSWVPGGNVAASATGIGYRTYTGTRTNASNQITGLSATTGLKIGQILDLPGNWTGTAPVRITNISGTTLTMSETWSGATDGAPVSLKFLDSIRIKTASEDQYYANSPPGALLFGLAIATASSPREIASAYTTGQMINDGMRSNASDYVYGSKRTMVLRQLLPSTGSFQVWATHGSEYDPQLPEPTVASGTVSTQDSFSNGLTWTKQDEPEHWMSSGTALWLVGNAKTPILRTIALTDGLYILKGKGDGVYRLTGVGELSGWRVDQLDPSSYLLHPELAVVLGDAIYAWTNNGMARIDASGVQRLSDPIGDQTIEQEGAIDSNATNHAFAFAVADPVSSEVIFGLPNSNTDNAAPANTFVYNVLRNAWSTWFGDASATPYTMALAHATGSVLLWHGGNSSSPSTERQDSATVVNADASYSVTISAVSGLNVTISAGSGWTPAVGDLLVRSTTYSVVTAITDPTHFAVQTAVTTGSATAYAAFTSTLTWLPENDPDAGFQKRYSDVVTHWDDTYGLYSWAVTLSGSRNPGSPVSQTYTRTYGRSGQVRDNTRALCTAAVALNAQLYPGLSIKQADARWRVTGQSINYEVASMVAQR